MATRTKQQIEFDAAHWVNEHGYPLTHDDIEQIPPENAAVLRSLERLHEDMRLVFIRAGREDLARWWLDRHYPKIKHLARIEPGEIGRGAVAWCPLRGKRAGRIEDVTNAIYRMVGSYGGASGLSRIIRLGLIPEAEAVFSADVDGPGAEEVLTKLIVLARMDGEGRKEVASHSLRRGHYEKLCAVTKGDVDALPTDLDLGHALNLLAHTLHNIRLRAHELDEAKMRRSPAQEILQREAALVAEGRRRERLLETLSYAANELGMAPGATYDDILDVADVYPNDLGHTVPTGPMLSDQELHALCVQLVDGLKRHAGKTHRRPAHVA